jgi:hypothetical protein
MIANQDFEITEGSGYILSVPLSSGILPGGAIVNWWASPSQFDAAGSVPLKKVSPTSITITTVGSQSVVAVYLNNVDTLGLGQKKLFHQARVTLTDGSTQPLFSGTMTVVKRLVV